MMLEKKELLKVVGGEATSTLINALSRGITIFLELGKIVGSAIRRVATGKSCSL